ncbi:MAG TPA: hypothetical protein VIL37_10785 [Natronosporangium sp.]
MSSYTGPPPTTPPPRDWRPPVTYQPLPPRKLPPQDHAALDAEERDARRFTLGLGAAAAVIAVVVACVLAGSLLT